MNDEFDDKVVLVTGAATGIGRATALTFGKAGARVVVADVDEARGNQTVADIRADGGSAVFHAADLTDPVAVDTLFDAIEVEYGRLDCAHNNVGFGWGRHVLETSLDDWRKTMDLCLTAPFLCLKREIPLMARGGGGAIVNTASMAGVRYAELASAPYTAAKAGVIALTRYAAVTHAADGVRINAVSPGLVSTEAVDKYLTYDQQVALAAQSQPIGRPIAADEIAATVLWLCSNAASMITGENICVAGGQQAR